MRSRRRIVALAALLVWLCTAGAGSAQTTLRYKFKAGDTIKYLLEQSTRTTMKVKDNIAETLTTQSSELIWSIQSVDAQGNAKIVIKFGRCTMSTEGPPGKIEVDSASTEAPDDDAGVLLYKIIKWMAKLEVNGTISPTGEYSDIKVADKALKELQSIPGSDAFGDLSSADGLKRMLSQSGHVMPKSAVSKGATWSSKAETKQPFGKLRAEAEYTYTGPESKNGRTLEKITLKPNATLEADPKATIVMKLKALEGAGTVYFDNVAGRLLEVASQQTMDIDGDNMGMTFTIRSVQTVNMRLVEKK